MVKNSPSNAGGAGSIPGWGAKIPQDSRPKKTKYKQQKQYCRNFNKNFKNSPYPKKLPECQQAEPTQSGSENHAALLRSIVSHLRGRKTRSELMITVFSHKERKGSQTPM